MGCVTTCKARAVPEHRVDALFAKCAAEVEWPFLCSFQTCMDAISILCPGFHILHKSPPSFRTLPCKHTFGTMKSEKGVRE